MFRKLLVIPVLLGALGACGQSKDAATVGQASGTPVSPTVSPVSPSVSPSACPTKSTETLAKTRFVADAGLAFGAFNRWIWKPYQDGAFKSGADGRTEALVKAAAAGAFAVNRLNAARKLVNADPTLCKVLKAPMDALWSGLSALTAKLKSGEFGDIGSVQSSLEELKSKASEAGVKISDKVASIPGG